MKKWLFIGLVALVSVTIGLIKSNRKLQKECERQSGNIAILMKDIKSYKIRDSLNAVSVSALNLTIDELKEYRADDAQTIKELGIKNKHLEALVKTGIHSTETIYADRWHPLPDRPDCLEVNSKWSHVIACFKDSTVYYNIRDSLAAIVHRIPKRKFLWWSWGTKGINWNWLILIPTQRLITMNL
ncbi:DUF6549 family protein [Bacteroides sp. CR5/BHMF/2]|nr:DUF6549 family protein [Bacteroides sp. CR5/BHMF/2]